MNSAVLTLKTVEAKQNNDEKIIITFPEKLNLKAN